MDLAALVASLPEKTRESYRRQAFQYRSNRGTGGTADQIIGLMQDVIDDMLREAFFMLEGEEDG